MLLTNKVKKKNTIRENKYLVGLLLMVYEVLLRVKQAFIVAKTLR